MVVLHGARVVLRDKVPEDAEQDYIWRSDPELARLDAAYPLTMSFDRYLKIFQDQLRYPTPGSHHFAAYILGRAISNPTLVGVVPRTAAVNFFRRRRNIVLALMSTYRPVGGAINIQIISFIAVHRGWRAAYRYWGILSLLLVLPLILIMRRRPEDIGMLPDGASPGEMARTDSLARTSRTGSGPDVEFSWTAREAWRTTTYWLIGATAVMGTIAAGTTGYSLVP